MHAFKALVLLALSIGVLSDDTFVIDGHYCPGSVYNNVCCVEGSWSGPLVSSLIGDFKSVESQLQSSIAGALSTAGAAGQSAASSLINLGNSVISEIGNPLTNLPARRAITTEVSSGLTCLGITAVTLTIPNASEVIAKATSAASALFTQGAVSSIVVNNNTLVATGLSPTRTSSSKAGAAMITQAPMLAIGGAALALAYGAMN